MDKLNIRYYKLCTYIIILIITFDSHANGTMNELNILQQFSFKDVYYDGNIYLNYLSKAQPQIKQGSIINARTNNKFIIKNIDIDKDLVLINIYASLHLTISSSLTLGYLGIITDYYIGNDFNLGIKLIF